MAVVVHRVHDGPGGVVVQGVGYPAEQYEGALINQCQGGVHQQGRGQLANQFTAALGVKMLANPGQKRGREALGNGCTSMGRHFCGDTGGEQWSGTASQGSHKR